jgi:hypothetical protein
MNRAVAMISGVRAKGGKGGPVACNASGCPHIKARRRGAKGVGGASTGLR